jgi:hypothetical protein
MGPKADGPGETILTPTALDTSLTFRSIAMSVFATCGLTDEGKAYCWGTNTQGHLGLGGDFNDDRHWPPVAVSGDLMFSALAGGNDGFCGLDQAGHSYCWAGAGAESGDVVSAPTATSGDLTFSQIAVGFFMNCAIATNGLKATYCWMHNGGNSMGDLGTGDYGDYKGPVPIAQP